MNEFKINDKNKITSGFSTPDGYFSDFSLELNKEYTKSTGFDNDFNKFSVAFLAFIPGS